MWQAKQNRYSDRRGDDFSVINSGAGTIFWLGGQKFIKTSVQNAEDIKLVKRKLYDWYTCRLQDVSANSGQTIAGWAEYIACPLNVTIGWATAHPAHPVPAPLVISDTTTILGRCQISQFKCLNAYVGSSILMICSVWAPSGVFLLEYRPDPFPGRSRNRKEG